LSLLQNHPLIEEVAEPGVQLRETVGRPRPWLYPQLLSVDTPLVSMAWQMLLARSFQVDLSAPTVVVSGICVWMIYASDHLLDLRRGPVYSERHEFALRHASTICKVISAAFVVGLALVFKLPYSIVRGGSLLSFAVLVYLLLVHTGTTFKRMLPKEVMVALIFAAGSSIAVWSDPHKWQAAWPELSLFWALCLLNCVAVDTCEWQRNPRRTSVPHPFTRWAGRHLTSLSLILAATAFVALGASSMPLALAVSAASIGLMVISRRGERWSPDSLRLIADGALLLPALLVLL
jgi:hypothetical protein